jgi:hypothetical protein
MVSAIERFLGTTQAYTASATASNANASQIRVREMSFIGQHTVRELQVSSWEN